MFNMPPKQVVIDLLSSPEVCLPTLKKTVAPAAKALTYVHSKPTNDGFMSLSSDDDDANEWPAEEPAPKSSALFGGSSWNFDNLEGSKQTTKHALAQIPAPKPKAVKGGGDFYFLEDDFDGAVNFDDSIVNDLPPAKKRRLSPSPKAVQKPKTGGCNMSLSNIESSTTSKLPAKRMISAPLKGAYTTSARIESDPIVFTSSPDPVADAARKRRERARKNVDSDSDLNILGLKTSNGQNQEPKKQDKGKGKMSELLPFLSSDADDDSIVALDQSPKRSVKNPSVKDASTTKRKDFSFEDSSDVDVPESRNTKAKSKPKPSSKPKSEARNAVDKLLVKYASSDTDEDGAETGKEKPKAKSKLTISLSEGEALIAKVKAERAKEKAAQVKVDAARSNKAAKETEKEEKRLEKERRAREKQKAAEIATVNTLRTDKRLTTPEMIVELPSCLDKKLMSRTKTFLDDVKASFEEWDSFQPVVKWKRKIIAEFDDDEGQWKPVPQYIRSEKHVMYVITAKELVQHVTGDEGHDLPTLVATLNSVYDSCKMIILMEGINAWFRQNRNIKNKEFVGAVISHGPPQAQPTASQRRKKKEDKYVDEQLVEDALMELQISHGFLIHHTGAMPETAQWIKIFTENISSVPYKKTNLDTGFCMETGQVKTGENTADTYTKMLQEMLRVTLPVACGIAYEYPTVQRLVKGFEKNGPSALEECRKSSNKDGAFTDRRVGKAISKRVYDVFMGKDAGSWDV